MAGPMLCGSHVMTMWLWIGLALSSTINGHSGYEFPWSPFKPSSNHDYHHSSFGSNYGAIGLMDWIHKTDVPYYAHLRLKAIKRTTSSDATINDHIDDDMTSDNTNADDHLKQN
jgi:hypothetical protein